MNRGLQAPLAKGVLAVPSIIRVALAAVALIFFGVTVMTASGSSVEMGAPVTAEQCYPCHARIAESRTPGLIFRHGAHIVAACDSCHPRMPHGPHGTERPTMASCFGCHGQYHAGVFDQLARKECGVCHTATWPLRPGDHSAQWAARPHADAVGDRGSNRCVMCHDAATGCDHCHRERDIDVPPVYPAYLPLVAAPDPRPALTLDLDAPVTAGQCLYCHYDIDGFGPGRIIFSHGDHLGRDYACEGCHPVFPHSPSGIAYNTMADCYRCHGLEHAGKGLVATEECLACHPPSFELKPVAHTAEFEARDHGESVAEDETYCTLCHKGPFCIECHRSRRVMADGSPPRYVIPVDHTESVWFSQHGPLYLARTGTCWACHDSASCERCHQTPMPHPGDWLGSHGRYETVPGMESDCSICHKDRQWCQECHHDSVRSLDLVEANCVPCHEIMAFKPATGIRHKKLAEHAVHFGVAESKGRPYRCYECHATWATRNGGGSEHAGSPGDIGHDLRLCYDCHGALDIRSTLIAPYRGSELCARCHTEGPSARDGSSARE